MSLPRFNFTHGFLETLSAGVGGVGEYVYNSTVAVENEELQFVPSKQRKGNLGLKDGYLLTVDGEVRGWTICDGALGEQVVWTFSTVSTESQC